MSDKPKEWWISNPPEVSSIYEEECMVSARTKAGYYGDDRDVKVIEKSAYDALKAELLELKEMMPRMVDSIPWANKLQRELCLKEKDQWQAQAEKLAEALKIAITENKSSNYVDDVANGALHDFAKLKEQIK